MLVIIVNKEKKALQVNNYIKVPETMKMTRTIFIISINASSLASNLSSLHHNGSLQKSLLLIFF